VVLASSTANDQLAQLDMTVSSLTLTSQSGKTVTVFSTPQTAEYTYLNGNVEPLTYATIPQDVYTAATASVGQSAQPAHHQRIQHSARIGSAGLKVIGSSQLL
jgi:hypothetical protein